MNPSRERIWPIASTGYGHGNIPLVRAHPTTVMPPPLLLAICFERASGAPSRIHSCGIGEGSSSISAELATTAFNIGGPPFTLVSVPTLNDVRVATLKDGG